LHKNCPDCRRLHAVCETGDGFGFQTGPAGHISGIEIDDNCGIDTLIQSHNMRQPDAD
jgi:hypothetical protein